MKAILVIDEMPANCKDCPCYCNTVSFNPYCTANGHDVDEQGKGRGEWCPLKPMPSFKAVDLNDTRDVVMFCHGWNTCLKEIE